MTSEYRQKDGGGSAGAASPVEAAAYIERLVGELKLLALRHELDFLAYVLDMAREEAVVQSRQIRRPEGKQGQA